MWSSLFCVFFAFFVQNAVCFEEQHMCAEKPQQRSKGCTTQLIGQEHAGPHYNSCSVEAPTNCSFGHIASNAYIGGVKMKPYILEGEKMGHTDNYTVLNVTFSNIKWKQMRFRFQLSNNQRNGNHCRNIVLSNDVSIDDQSVLYYDCYWALAGGNYNGQSHILDFEATDDKVTNRGQYHFNIPSPQMLSPTVTAEEWVPFVYLEILTDVMRLHVMPPLPRLNITGYLIRVIKETDKVPVEVESAEIPLKNNSEEATYDYSLFNKGSHYFVVTPLHKKCHSGTEDGCRSVDSPKMFLVPDTASQQRTICIASVAAVVVALLFGYYLILRLLNRYCPLASLPTHETTALVVYSPTNHNHAVCVESFVKVLRCDYKIDVKYDGDISSTADKNPFNYTMDAFDKATHIICINGPAEPLISLNNPYRNLDNLSTNLIKANAGAKNPKKIMNVYFEYSGNTTSEINKLGKSFHLMKDWNKMIDNLAENKGRSVLDRFKMMKLNHRYKHGVSKTTEGQVFLKNLEKATAEIKQYNIC